MGKLRLMTRQHMFTAKLIKLQLISGTEGSIPDENRKIGKRIDVKRTPPIFKLISLLTYFLDTK